jgi:gluconokinase
LLNYHTGQYDTQMMDLLPSTCIAALPIIANDNNNNLSSLNKDVSATTSSLTLNEIYLRRWPLLRNARFFLGVGDGACANIGSKCTSMNRIACTIGTSAAARVCLYYPVPLSQTTFLVRPPDDDNPNDRNEEIASTSDDSSSRKLRIAKGLFCYRIDRYHVLIGGALTDGGNVIEWIDKHLLVQRNEESLSTNDIATSSTSKLESAMHGAAQLLNDEYNAYCLTKKLPTPSLMVIPFFSGERNTGYRSNATGVMIGLTLQTRSHHIVKACLEGITLRLHAIIQLICATVTPLLEQQTDNYYNSHDKINDSSNNDSNELLMMILCSGKALEKNQLWRTMIADCSGLPVYMEEQTYEGTSRGAAILMQHALFQPTEEISPLSGSLAVEVIDFPSSSDDSTTNSVMVQTPNLSVKGYWKSLLVKQEAIIEALSTTSYWS